jgi:hypothetical protein
MEQPIADVLRARRIEVFDRAGTARIVLRVEVDEGGNDIALVSLSDPTAVEHVALFCDQEVAALELVEQGDAVATLSSNREGGAWLTLPEAG